MPQSRILITHVQERPPFTSVRVFGGGAPGPFPGRHLRDRPFPTRGDRQRQHRRGRRPGREPGLGRPGGRSGRRRRHVQAGSDPQSPGGSPSPDPAEAGGDSEGRARPGRVSTEDFAQAQVPSEEKGAGRFPRRLQGLPIPTPRPRCPGKRTPAAAAPVEPPRDPGVDSALDRECGSAAAPARRDCTPGTPARVEQRVGQNWLRASLGALARPVETVVSFEVLRNGRIHRIKLEQPSGVGAVDLAAQRAIRASSPLPALPPELRNRRVRFVTYFQYPPR